MKAARRISKDASDGFSLVEILVVLVIIAIIAAISVPYIVSYKRLYKSEDQSIKLIDLMRESSQLALNKRKTIRFEIDLTDNAALIIDENVSGAAVQLKKIPLEKVNDIRMDIIPNGITKPNPPNYGDAVFGPDSLGHLAGTTTVTGHSVWAARFRSDGTVVDSTNIPVSANLYIWPPISTGSDVPRHKSEVRAITIFGGTGSVRYWKHDGTTFVAS